MGNPCFLHFLIQGCVCEVHAGAGHGKRQVKVFCVDCIKELVCLFEVCGEAIVDDRDMAVALFFYFSEFSEDVFGGAHLVLMLVKYAA